MKKELTVEAGKTYWGVRWDKLKQCKILGTPRGGYCDVHARFENEAGNWFTWYADSIREEYPYTAKKTAQKALVRALEKDADKAFTARNKLMNRLHKEREKLKALS